MALATLFAACFNLALLSSDVYGKLADELHATWKLFLSDQTRGNSVAACVASVRFQAASASLLDRVARMPIMFILESCHLIS